MVKMENKMLWTSVVFFYLKFQGTRFYRFLRHVLLHEETSWIYKWKEASIHLRYILVVLFPLKNINIIAMYNINIALYGNIKNNWDYTL